MNTQNPEENYQKSFDLAFAWADKSKTQKNFEGSLGLCIYLLLQLVNELNLKIENKTDNYKQVMGVCTLFVRQNFESKNQFVSLTAILLNSGIKLVQELENKVENQFSNFDKFWNGHEKWSETINNNNDGNFERQCFSLFLCVIKALDLKFSYLKDKSLVLTNNNYRTVESIIDLKQIARKKYLSML